MNNNQNLINEVELGNLLDNTFNDFCEIYNNKNVNDENELNQNHGNNIGEQNIINVVDDEQNIVDKSSTFDNDDDKLKENLSKLAKSCNQTIDNDLHESILTTLNTISEKAKLITKDNVYNNNNNNDVDELSKMLTNINKLQNNNDNDNDDEIDVNDDENLKDNLLELNKIMPLMSNIMENLLSKDFLYQTLSELRTKYPKYLLENQTKLSKNDYQRYENQLKIINKICEEFENDDNEKMMNDESKHLRFNRILSLMQTMQTFGTPPSELVSTTNNGNDNDINMMSNDFMNNFNINDLLQQQQQDKQCKIM